jgi:thiamine biosynthesis protein ThiC
MVGQLLISLFKSVWPYMVTFLLGVLVAWQGCGTGTTTITETVEIEKPVYKTEYVDRWKTDTVRFVQRITVTDTITNTIIQEREVLMIDTVRIIEAWLTEVNRYDTTITLADGSLQATWFNYQNLTEEAAFTYTSEVQKATSYGVGIHASIEAQTDFIENVQPLFGVGLHGDIKKMYITANYKYNGDHFIGVTVGRKLWQR